MYALHIFSGPGEIGAYRRGNTTLKAIVRDYSERYGSKVSVEVIEFDYLNCDCSSGGGACCAAGYGQPFTASCGKRCGNLLREEVYSQLLADCKRGKFIAVVAGIPCDGYW